MHDKIILWKQLHFIVNLENGIDLLIFSRNDLSDLLND